MASSSAGQKRSRGSQPAEAKTKVQSKRELKDEQQVEKLAGKMKQKLNLQDGNALPGGSQLADAGGRMPALPAPLSYRAVHVGSIADMLKELNIEVLEVQSEKFNSWVKVLGSRVAQSTSSIVGVADSTHMV